MTISKQLPTTFSNQDEDDSCFTFDPETFLGQAATKPRASRFSRASVLHLLTQCHSGALLAVYRRLNEFYSFLLGTTAISSGGESPVTSFLEQTLTALDKAIRVTDPLASYP